MSITDALSRISQIQQQLSELSDGTVTGASATQSTATTTSPAAAAATATATDGTATTSGTSFANALSQAQGTAATDTTSGGSGVGVTSSPAATTDATFGSAVPASVSTDAIFPSSVTSQLATGGVGMSATASQTGSALPTGAGSLLNANQQQFAATLAADTGLNPGVVSAWVLAEESGGAAQSRQAQNNNDWLNIGYTDSGTYGASDSVWSDPVTAANATAGWLKGQETIPGYGAASAGVQAIVQTVGQTPEAQIAALQSSGWASSGYPNLPGLYDEVTA